MPKYIIEINNRPPDCGSCCFAYTHYTTGEDWCCTLLKEVEYLTIDKDCPIKELKPKQLVWCECADGSLQANPNDELIYTVDGECPYFNNKYIRGSGKMNRDELKEYCQQHYNNIFYEMIGGE